jgi:hypothetical protein
MPPKKNYFEVRAARAAKKLLKKKLFWDGIFWDEKNRNVERSAKSSQKFVVDLSTFL